MADTSRAARVPSIPAIPTSADAATRSWMQAVGNIIQVMTGQTGNNGDVVVRQRDLTALKTDYNLEDLTSEPSGDIPNPPTNLQCNQILARNILTWEDPVKSDDVESVEVWFSTSQNRSDASRVGITPKGVQRFDHASMDFDSGSYYWIRSVSYGGKYSVWEPSDAQGGLVVPAILQQTIDDMLGVLFGNLSEDQLVNTLKTRLDKIEGNEDGIIAISEDVDNLFAQYTIKVDAGGHIVGFGLASSPAGSEFVILADKFLIVKPDGSGTPKAMFVVTTINGVTGVGITGDVIADGAVISRSLAANAVTATHVGANEVITNSANIKDAVVTRAKIANAAIGNAQIEDLSVNMAKISDTLQSTNYVAGYTGWRILKSGIAEFNGVVINRDQIVTSGTRININQTIDSGSSETIIEVDTGFNQYSSVSNEQFSFSGDAIVRNMSWNYYGSMPTGTHIADIEVYCVGISRKINWVVNFPYYPPESTIVLRFVVKATNINTQVNYITINSLEWALKRVK